MVFTAQLAPYPPVTVEKEKAAWPLSPLPLAPLSPDKIPPESFGESSASVVPVAWLPDLPEAPLPAGSGSASSVAPGSVAGAASLLPSGASPPPQAASAAISSIAKSSAATPRREIAKPQVRPSCQSSNPLPQAARPVCQITMARL